MDLHCRRIRQHGGEPIERVKEAFSSFMRTSARPGNTCYVISFSDTATLVVGDHLAEIRESVARGDWATPKSARAKPSLAKWLQVPPSCTRGVIASDVDRDRIAKAVADLQTQSGTNIFAGAQLAMCILWPCASSP